MHSIGPNGSVKYYRFQCDTTWNSRGVVFVADTSMVFKRAHLLEWNERGRWRLFAKAERSRAY